jgi:hypothetical protein
MALLRNVDVANRAHKKKLTVILALDDFLQTNMKDLIQRQPSAHRLVLVPRAGHWPGTASFGDLALASTILGWGAIELYRDLVQAVEASFASAQVGDQLLMVLPDRSKVPLRLGRAHSATVPAIREMVLKYTPAGKR